MQRNIAWYHDSLITMHNNVSAGEQSSTTHTSITLMENALKEYVSTNEHAIDFFLVALFSYGHAAGVSITECSIGEQKKHAWYHETPITIDLRGEFIKILDLLNKILDNKHCANIGTIVLARQQESLMQCTLELSYITVRTL